MSLFADALTFTLTDEELLTFKLMIHQPGGPQNLYRKLEQQLVDAGSGDLTLEDEELLTIQRYAYEYGTGGYQNCFRAVMAAACRAGWTPHAGEPVERRPSHRGRRWDGQP